jgi:hypothetical protein
MEIEVIRQCDAGSGMGRKALFPGQRYDLPEGIANELAVAGHVRIFGGAREALVPSALDHVRIAGRPRGKTGAR